MDDVDAQCRWDERSLKKLITRLRVHVKMDAAVLLPQLLSCAANGVVYGICRNGDVVRYAQGSVRSFAARGKGDFDDCEVDATFRPVPPPSFPVVGGAVTDGGGSVLVEGSDPASYGILRLEAKRRTEEVGVYEVPFRKPAAIEGEAEVRRVRWFGGEAETLCVLREDATLALYDAAAPLYAERVYQLRRHVTTPLGVAAARRAAPVDFAFASSLPWGPLSVLVLYEDGCVYVLCPVLPTVNLQTRLVTAATRRPVEEPLLKALLRESLSQDSAFPVQHVPVMQGPINAGLESDQAKEFVEGSSDLAVCLSCASCREGCLSVTVGTRQGVLYSHALIEDIRPKILSAEESVITPSGTRLCTTESSAAVLLHLVERLELHGALQSGARLQIWQHPCHPEILYCRRGESVTRVRVNWVYSMVTENVTSSRLEKSEMWNLSEEAEFRGSFHVLDASIAVFGHGHRNFTSVHQTPSLYQCHVELLPQPLSGGSDLVSGAALGTALAGKTDPVFAPLLEAYQKFRYASLDDAQFDASLELLEDEAAGLKDWMEELEASFASYRGQTGRSIRALVQFVETSWPENAVRETVESIKAQLE